MINQLKPLMGKLCTFAKDRMGFEHPPKLFLKSDAENSQMALGRTAHYDPNEESITLYITNRHPKDILRSLAHELVHHTQNLRGDLAPEKMGAIGKNYAQDNDHMRNMEKEAYLQGNMCFRDWEDGLDNKELFIIKLAESNFLKQTNKEKKPVNIKELKETIRQVVEAATSTSSNASDDEVKNPGPYINGERAKAGQDDDGDGIPNGADPESKDGDIPAESSSEEEKKPKTTKESKSMTTKITKEFLKNTIKEILDKQINVQEDVSFKISDKEKSAIRNAPNKKAAGLIARKLLMRKGLKSMTLRKGIDQVVRSHYNPEGMNPDGTKYAKDSSGADKSAIAQKVKDSTILKFLDKDDQEGNFDAAAMDKKFANAYSDNSPAAAAQRKAAAEKAQARYDKALNRASGEDEEELDGKKMKASPTKSTLPESINTPENEEALYEHRFDGRNEKLYQKLLKEWTK